MCKVRVETPSSTNCSGIGRKLLVMNERLDHRPTRIDLHHLNEMLHNFLMMFRPHAAEPQQVEDIDWEDGEIEDQTEGPAR